MLRVLFFLISCIIASVLSVLAYIAFSGRPGSLPVTLMANPSPTPHPKPLNKYSIPVLSGQSLPETVLVFDQAVGTASGYTKYSYHYLVDGKKVTGLATVPNTVSPHVVMGESEGSPSGRKLPAIVQYRGYVDREKYTPGEGTKRSAEQYAQAGYAVFAPDFLGKQ